MRLSSMTPVHQCLSHLNNDSMSQSKTTLSILCIVREWSRSSGSILPRRLTSRLFIATSGIILCASVHVRGTSRMLIVEPCCCLAINISVDSSDADEVSYFVIRSYNSFVYVTIKPWYSKRQVGRSSAAYTVCIITAVVSIKLYYTVYHSSIDVKFCKVSKFSRIFTVNFRKDVLEV